MKFSIFDFSARKMSNQKISMVTCYDYSFARLVNSSNVDCVLVGDSLASVMHGEVSTLPATVELMALHTKAVRRGMPDKFLVADMPFLSTRQGKAFCVRSAGRLLRCGADAVKIEGAEDNLDMIIFLVQSGIPVMGHLGLTPQFYHSLGGFKVQCKNEEAVKKIVRDAIALEKSGAFAVVVECVPDGVALQMSKAVSIPVIGIGAGKYADGQVLVLHDLLGLSDFNAKFVRQFLDGKNLVKNALDEYDCAVKLCNFPSKKESF